MLLELVCAALGIAAIVSTLTDKVEYAIVALLFVIYFKLEQITSK